MKSKQQLSGKPFIAYNLVGALLLGEHLSFAFSQNNPGSNHQLTLTYSPATEDLRQNQAKAITESISDAQASSLSRSLLTSNEVEKTIRTQKTQNIFALNSVGVNAVNKARASLPKMSHLAEELKYGRHVTISKNGEEIIILIRNLTQAKPLERDRILRQLQIFSEQGLPEALNFFGFAFEHGILGANRDMHKAIRYYQASAAAHYQPALYNLALIAAYGRSGKANSNTARAIAQRANALGLESSARVCGLSSFLSYRAGLQAVAHKVAQHCLSPLANFALATDDRLALDKRLALLRITLATGVDDAYKLIEQITRPIIVTDNNYTFCKYVLVDRYRHKTVFHGLQEAAAQCVDKTKKFSNTNPNTRVLRDQVIAGITAFVPTEISTLRRMRQSNRFHYGWSVPYLPFGQHEVNLFEKLMTKGES